MALPSSAYLFIQNDKNRVERELNHNALMKTSLTREMNKVSSEYQNALNAKVLKWSNNSGVSYQDLTYSNLMSPSAMNGQKPYLITDSSDRVVIASNYKKYAEMISQNGAPGGDYESNRMQILSELVGVNESQFNSLNGYQSSADAAQAELKQLDKEKAANDKLKPSNKKTEDLLEKALGSYCSGGSFDGAKNWKDAFHSGKSIKFSSKSGLDSLATQLKQLAPYLELDTEDFDKKVDEKIASIKSAFDSIDTDNKELTGNDLLVSGKKGDYKVNVQKLITTLLISAGATKVESNESVNTGSTTNFEWVDYTTEEYKNWKEKDDAINAKIQTAQAAYDSAVTSKSGVFTADQERKIEFYDAIFTAIAEKGWTYNEDVSDTNYLNEMLQNGSYYLTTMQKSLYSDGANNDGSNKFSYEYSTGIAENDSHVYKVNDSSQKDIALAIYEEKKRTINAKETKLDTRNSNLQTRLAADNQMLQSYQQLMKDNFDRTMNWCG